MKKILLIGTSGQVGSELSLSLVNLGHVVGVDRAMLDLTHPEQIRSVVESVKPDIIVNAAAYTAVDLAEKEKKLAFQINCDAPDLLAKLAKKQGLLLVHYSTDYVFDGKCELPYREEDQTNPESVYGHSKLAGEAAIHASGCNHLIFRTSWVYGMHGKNFLLTILRLAKERDQLKIVADQIGAPTWCASIAKTTAQVLQSCINSDQSASYGLYHMTSLGRASWYDFTKEILDLYKKKNPEFKVPSVEKITTADYLTAAKRPAFSVLSNDKLKSHFGVQLPNWKDALVQCYQLKGICCQNM